MGIKAAGKYKLVVSLERKIPYFKLLMASPRFFPQTEQAVKKYGYKYGTASKYMVYNGQFVHKGWTGSNLSWKLVRNKYYWDKKDVKLTQINYSVQKSPSAKKYTSYNKQLAKQYFEKGLKEEGLSKLSFTLLASDDDTSKKLAEFVQSQLETAFGKQDHRQGAEHPFQDRVLAGNFECTLSGSIANYADPISFLDCETTGNSYNYGNWSNKEYDKLIMASKTSSGTVRMKLLAKAENILMVNQGVTPLTQANKAWMIKSKVKAINDKHCVPVK